MWLTDAQTESMAKPAELAAPFAICARSVKLDDLEIDILSRTVAVARNEDARQQPAMLSADGGAS
jgi:hypothetical protein